MNNYYVTFGQSSPFSEGWVLIRAESYEKARGEVFVIFGEHFCAVYDEENFEPEYFSAGQLGRTIEI